MIDTTTRKSKRLPARVQERISPPKRSGMREAGAAAMLAFLATEDNKAFPNSAWYHLVESYTGLNRSEAKTALDDLEADGKVTIDGTSGEIAVRVIQPIIKEIATAEKT